MEAAAVAVASGDVVAAAAGASDGVSFVPKSSTRAAVSFVPKPLPERTRARDLGRNGARLDIQRRRA
jgi:hypothetical protein